jgi:hypothetical protein
MGGASGIAMGDGRAIGVSKSDGVSGCSHPSGLDDVLLPLPYSASDSGTGTSKMDSCALKASKSASSSVSESVSESSSKSKDMSMSLSASDMLASSLSDSSGDCGYVTGVYISNSSSLGDESTITGRDRRVTLAPLTCRTAEGRSRLSCATVSRMA